MKYRMTLIFEILAVLLLFTACSVDKMASGPDRSDDLYTDDISNNEKGDSFENPTVIDGEDGDLAAVEVTAETDIVDSIKSELDSKGWKDIEVSEGFLDEKIKEQTGLVLDRTDEEKKMNILSVSGQIEGKYDNPLFAVVELVYGDEMSQGEIYQIFYISSSGRMMTPENSGISDLEPNSLLSADNQELWDYMYSY